MTVVPFRRRSNGLATMCANLMNDSAVQIAGRDGSMSLANPGCTFLDPSTGQAISANRAYNLVGPGGLTLPMYTAFPAATNLFLNATAPATQDCSVVTGSVTVTAIGTGYTVTTSAGTATGSGFGLVTNGTAQVLTITGNGTITLTIAGTPANACVQVQAGALRTPLLVTDGSTKTRAADANVWTMADVLTQDEEIIVFTEQDYASGDMVIASQHWVEGVVTQSYPRLFRSAANLQQSADFDTAGRSSDNTVTTPSVGVVGMRRLRRFVDGVQGGYGTSLLGSKTAGSSFIAQTQFRLGHSGTANRATMGRVACIRRKGGFSQAQIDALYYAFANGRTVPVLA